MKIHMKDFLLKPLPSKWFLGTFFLLFWAGKSWGTCTLSGTNANTTFLITVPATPSVPKNIPIGTEVYRSSAVALSGYSNFTCNNDPWGYFNNQGATSTSGPSPIGDTGLGWAWVYRSAAVGPYPKAAGTLSGNRGFNGTSAASALQIVKMADVVAGTIPGGTIGTLRVGTNNVEAASMVLSNAMNITEVSCQTPSVNVALGKQRSGEFGAVGSIIGQKAFNIQLNDCPSGLSNISYRLDPVNTAFDATKGILALDAGGATGVGIQITDGNSTAVGLGVVKRFLTAPVSGSYSIPLRAAYYKTASTVTPGVAKASMQFTITYQ